MFWCIISPQSSKFAAILKNDVRKLFGTLDPFPVCISRNRSILLICKIRPFFNHCSPTWCGRHMYKYRPFRYIAEFLIQWVSAMSKKVKVAGDNFLSPSGRAHLKSTLWWQDGKWHQMIAAAVAGFSEKYTEKRIFGDHARARFEALSSVTHFGRYVTPPRVKDDDGGGERHA